MQGLEVFDYRGAGYDPTFCFGAWRVAYLNYAERFDKKGITYLEKHNETDELFLLMEGSATLLMGKDAEEVEMDRFKMYVVKKGEWHGIIVSEDARVLVVENDDTTKENSEYMPFSY